MSQVMKQLRDGSWIVANDDIIRDGERVRIGMPFIDAASKHMPQVEQQRPRQGQLGATDSVLVVCAHAKMIERQKNAWRDAGGPLPSARSLEATREPIYPQAFVAQQSNGDGASAAYAAYKRRLEDGYRHAKSSHPWRA